MARSPCWKRIAADSATGSPNRIAAYTTHGTRDWRRRRGNGSAFWAQTTISGMTRCWCARVIATHQGDIGGAISRAALRRAAFMERSDWPSGSRRLYLVGIQAGVFRSGFRPHTSGGWYFLQDYFRFRFINYIYDERQAC